MFSSIFISKRSDRNRRLDETSTEEIIYYNMHNNTHGRYTFNQRETVNYSIPNVRVSVIIKKTEKKNNNNYDCFSFPVVYFYTI